MKINSIYAKMEDGDRATFRVSQFDGLPAIDFGAFGSDVTIWLTWDAVTDMREKLDALLALHDPDAAIKAAAANGDPNAASYLAGKREVV